MKSEAAKISPKRGFVIAEECAKETPVEKLQPSKVE